MAYAAQFRGPGGANPIVFSGATENQAARDQLRQTVGNWAGNVGSGLGVLVAADAVQVMQLLDAWAREMNPDGESDATFG